MRQAFHHSAAPQAFNLKNGLKLLATSKHTSSFVRSISDKENKLFTAA
jgi:hypothetical protein